VVVPIATVAATSTPEMIQPVVQPLPGTDGADSLAAPPASIAERTAAIGAGGTLSSTRTLSPAATSSRLMAARSPAQCTATLRGPTETSSGASSGVVPAG